MRHIITRCSCLALFAFAVGGQALAQELPTSQPNMLQIVREEVKVGQEADHMKTEAGWPAAFEKAKHPYSYIALVSITGPTEAWFVQPFDSHTAMADDLKRSDEPTLAAELARLAKADAQHISASRRMTAVARKDLSRGAFPDTAKQRFYEITTFRIRPGHEEQFASAAKTYGAAAARSAPNIAFRVYEVIAGMPSPTYIVFSSVTAFGDFDKMLADGQALMKGATAQERAELQKFDTEALISGETQRFRLDPEMSYVPKATRASDPAFWMPKKPVTTTTSTKKPAQH
jgi:hypothetical protein